MESQIAYDDEFQVYWPTLFFFKPMLARVKVDLILVATNGKMCQCFFMFLLNLVTVSNESPAVS